MKNPQLRLGKEDLSIKSIPPNKEIVNIVPQEKTKLCFLILAFDNPDDLMRENIFIEIMGKTQGMKFKIIPPNNPKNNINNIFCEEYFG